MRDGKWVLLDCDDVILDIMDGFSRHVREDLGIDVKGLPGQWLMGAWLGMSDEDALSCIMNFNENHESFGSLRPLPGAIEGIRMIKEAGYQVAVITASSTGEASKIRRLKNLRDHAGEMIDEVHFVGLGESKLPILSSFPPSVWVDDSPKNAVVGLEAGHRAVLFPAHHNAAAITVSPPGVIAVSGWGALLDLIPGVRMDDIEPAV